MKKQVFGGILLSFVSQLVNILIGLIYMPIMIRILGQNEYGLYQFVQSIVNYLNLMNFGFSGAYIRYFSIAKGENDENQIANINGVFLKIFFCISALSIVVGFVLFCNIRLLSPKLTDSDYLIASELLLIMVLNLAIGFPSNVFFVYLSANQRFVFLKLLSVISSILLPVLSIPLLVFGYGSVGVVSVTLLLTIFRLGLVVWYSVTKMSIHINLKYNDFKIFKDLFGYTFFIFLSDLVDQLNNNVDKFLLGRMIGTTSVAVYSVGFDLKYFYTIVSWVVPEMFIPEVNRLVVEENDNIKISDLFCKIGVLNNYICLLMISGFVLFGKQFIRLWVGADYDNSFYVCLILLISGYVPAIQTLGVNIQNAKNMHRIRSIVYFIIACMNVICSIFLIRKLGEIGTAIGTLIAVVAGSVIFMNFYYFYFLKLRIYEFWRSILKWTIPVILLCVFSHFIIDDLIIDSWGVLTIAILFYTFIYIILLWFIGIGDAEKKKMIERIKSYKRIERN